MNSIFIFNSMNIQYSYYSAIKFNKLNKVWNRIDASQKHCIREMYHTEKSIHSILPYI